MRELVDAHHSFGFEIHASSLSFVEVIKRKKEITIANMKTLAFDVESEHRTPFFHDENDQRLMSRADAYLTVLGIEATDCLVRTLQVPLKKESDVSDALPFQAEPLLPFPLEEAVLDWIKVDQDDKGTTLTFAAVKKETIAKTLKQAGALLLEPEIISTHGSSLAAFSKQFTRTLEPHFVVHMGEEHSLFTLVFKGKLIATQGSKISMKEIKKALSEDMHEENQEKVEKLLKQLDVKQIDAEKYPKLSACFTKVRLDITRNIFGLSKQMKGEAVEKVVMTGALSAFPNIKEYLLDEIEKKELFLEVPSSILKSIEELAYYALPVGLALQGVDPSSQINFRQGAFSYPKPLKRILKPLFIYLGSCFLLSLSLFIFGSTYFGYKENSLRGDYVTLLESMNKTYQEGEADFAGIKESKESYEPINIKNLSVKAIDERLDKLEKEIRLAPDFIALNPNMPRVSDTLAWLTSHPNVGTLATPLKNGEQMILIENFAYTLVKRPEEKKRDSKYQAKVEIEFTTPSPKIAREFHDALIAPNEMVDPKGEIKWSSTRGKYRTSFFLKDKTYYPSERNF